MRCWARGHVRRTPAAGGERGQHGRAGVLRGRGLRRDRAAEALLPRRVRRGRDGEEGTMSPVTDQPLVLGIETSCDETGVGIVRGHTLLADAVASSVEEHARFGGVVPEVASRAHLEAMVPTIERACSDAGVSLRDVDAIAVTNGPGLAGALLVGVAAAKALAIGLGKPVYGVNHLASHVAVDQLEHGPLPVAVRGDAGQRRPLVAAARHRRDRRGRGRGAPWAPRSTTPRGRRSTRSPGCSGCRSRAARTSTGRPGPGRRCRSTSRAASPRGATWSGTASTSRSPASRPPSPAGSRPASAPASRSRSPTWPRRSRRRSATC